MWYLHRPIVVDTDSAILQVESRVVSSSILKIRGFFHVATGMLRSLFRVSFSTELCNNIGTRLGPKFSEVRTADEVQDNERGRIALDKIMQDSNGALVPE